MAAARFSSDVMRTFYEPTEGDDYKPIPEDYGLIPVDEDEPMTKEELIQALDQLYTLPPKDVFILARNNYQDWLRVWRMDVSRGMVNNGDLLGNKAKFTDLVENEIKELKSVKVSFGFKVEFLIGRNDEMQYMEHYFREEEPHVFNRHDKELIKQEFDRFVERAKGEIEDRSANGSGWVLERIMLAYVNVARYQPLRGGTYLPLPANMAKKKAIINMENRDSECLEWALRAAIYPAPKGKKTNRPSSYQVNDGINYEGINFPTPVKQIDKLEAQNRSLTINVFGWENNFVIVDGISGKKTNVPRINLMLIESGETQHYCYIKRVSALLFDQSKKSNAKYYYMLCLTGFSRDDLLENHKKYYNGVNGRPTRIEMPEEGENTVASQKSSQTDEGAVRDICRL